MKRRVLLAWEGGAGRGHIVTLKVMAEALGPQYEYDAALCRMDHAAELSHLCTAVYPSAALYNHRKMRKAAGAPGTATWGDFLGDLVFAFPDRLRLQFDWWVEVLRTRQIDLVIADFAPVSMLAARALNIPFVCVGTGYSVPPPGMPSFPVLLPQYDTLVHDEALLRDNANAILSEFGVPPLQHFADIYQASVSMPRTIRQLDPYDGLRSQPLLPPLNEALPRGEPGGDEIFVYFSTAETAYEPLVDALCQICLPTRAYLPGVAPDISARLSAAGVLVETAPVPVELIARRSRITLNAGQHGSLCMGLGLGLPQLAFPQHLEHEYHAQRAAQLGAVDIVPHERLNASEIVDRVRSLYHDLARNKRVRELSASLYPDLFGDIAGLVRQRVEPLLA
ncbi:hypothetical protein [Devosia sp. XK-2]|uniref:glycosyltransferase n=1 Tax=Devosia sp. XK-2 TaxID=3126689 RepID=UPI0030D1B271